MLAEYMSNPVASWQSKQYVWMFCALWFCQPEAGFLPDEGRTFAELRPFIFNTLRRTGGSVFYPSCQVVVDLPVDVFVFICQEIAHCFFYCE